MGVCVDVRVIGSVAARIESIRREKNLSGLTFKTFLIHYDHE